MGRVSFGQQLARVSEGLLESVTDLLLFQFYLTTQMVGAHTTFQMERAVDEAHNILDDVNYKTIKSVLYTLTQTKHIERTAHRTILDVSITDLGKKRITSRFPMYHDKRPWDGHMYLVSYDIPNKARGMRNVLREQIRKAGAALLQESLWVTPYNPHLLLEDFSQRHHHPGTIIVSKLGRDGAIGAENLTDLLVRIYHLASVSSRYEKFIETYGHTRPQITLSASIAYCAILKDDPQLPFPLEPKNFPGKRAHDLFLRILANG